MKLSIVTYGMLMILLSCCNIPYSAGIEAEVHDSKGNLVSVVGTPNTNPFQVGTWGLLVLITNAIVFVCLTIFSHSSLIKIRKLINFITDLEVCPKHAFVIVLSVLSIFIVLNINKLNEEENFGDYQLVKEVAEKWNVSVFHFGLDSLDLKYFFLHLSLVAFNNIRIFPFASSISLLVITYLFTTELSGKRLSGILAIVILLQSRLFSTYAVSATEDNFWVLFYILALYLLIKRFYLSPISYIASLLSKALTVSFLPILLLFTYGLDISKKKKIQVTIAYGIIVVLMSIVLATGIGIVKKINFNFNGFLTGFTVGSLHLHDDVLIVLFMIPLTVGLFLVSQNKVRYADNMLILLAGAILSNPLLSLFTDFSNQPYRLMPLIVFFAVGVGMLFSKKDKMIYLVTRKTRLVSNTIFLTTLALVLVFSASFIFPALIPSIFSPS